MEQALKEAITGYDFCRFLVENSRVNGSCDREEVGKRKVKGQTKDWIMEVALV